jgi:type IV pilus assembly protein PilN
MRARLNLATKPLQTHRRFLASSGLTIFIAGIIFLLLGWHVYSVRQAEAVRRTRTAQNLDELQRLQKQRSDLERYFNQPEVAKLSGRAAFFNSIIDQSSFNWTQMFMDLEHVLPVGVRVVSIQPQLLDGNMQVKLTVATSSDDAKVKFLRALQASKVFTGLILTGEHAPSDTSKGTETTVDLQVIYSRA